MYTIVLNGIFSHDVIDRVNFFKGYNYTYIILMFLMLFFNYWNLISIIFLVFIFVLNISGGLISGSTIVLNTKI